MEIVNESAQVYSRRTDGTAGSHHNVYISSPTQDFSGPPSVFSAFDHAAPSPFNLRVDVANSSPRSADPRFLQRECCLFPAR
jgi:hypothetical protein